MESVFPLILSFTPVLLKVAVSLQEVEPVAVAVMELTYLPLRV